MIKHIMVAALWCMAITLACRVQALPQDNTLGRLWPVVLQSYPGIRSKEVAVDAARFRERAVKAGKIPQIHAQAQNTYGTYSGTAGAFFPQPGFFNVSSAPVPLRGSSVSSNTFGSATVEWELFSFGKQQREDKAARARTATKTSDKEAYLLDLKKALSERYIALLYQELKLSWNSRNTDRLRDIRILTSGLARSGIRPAADSLFALSSFTQSLAGNERLEGDRKAALIQLQELYGDTPVHYQASLVRFREPVPHHPAGEPTMDQTHPLLAGWNYQADFYRWSSAVQKSAALPSLRLLGGYAFRGSGIGTNGMVSGKWRDGFSNPSGNFLAGIGITWNLSNLHTNRLQSKAYLKEAESMQMVTLQYQQAMQADLSATYSRIVQQYEQIRHTTTAVRQARDAYEMYLSRYKSGIMGLYELLQIRLLLETAENTHIEALREYWTQVAHEASLTADFDFLFNYL